MASPNSVCDKEYQLFANSLGASSDESSPPKSTSTTGTNNAPSSSSGFDEDCFAVRKYETSALPSFYQNANRPWHTAPSFSDGYSDESSLPASTSGTDSNLVSSGCYSDGSIRYGYGQRPLSLPSSRPTFTFGERASNSVGISPLEEILKKLGISPLPQETVTEFRPAEEVQVTPAGASALTPPGAFSLTPPGPSAQTPTGGSALTPAEFSRPPVGPLSPGRFIQRRNNFPRPNVFEFSPASPPYPLPPTKLSVFTSRKTNFANSTIQFVIQILNSPPGLQATPEMFQITVFSPTKEPLVPRIRRSDSFIVNSLFANFISTDEIGLYEVTVKFYPNKNVRRGTTDQLGQLEPPLAESTSCIPVSKNYSQDAGKERLKISCEFLRGEIPQRSGGSQNLDQYCKLWGLTCNVYNNHLFYTDRKSNLVHSVSPNGQAIFKFGDPMSSSPLAQLNRPTGICFDSVSNRLIVCDKDNHRVCFFSLNGRYIDAFGQRGHNNGMFDYPWDVAATSNGNIIVSDSKNKRLQMFDKFGNYLSKYTVFEKNPFEYRAQFDAPRGVTVDNEGKYCYVTDFNVSNVIKIPMDFSDQRILCPAKTLIRPQGITVDSMGNLLVADTRHDCVQNLSSDGDMIFTVRRIVREHIRHPINVVSMAGDFLAVLTADGQIRIF